LKDALVEPSRAVDAEAQTPERRDPYAALRYRDLRLVLAGRFIATLGELMISVAIGWELYQRTNSALALGFVGLTLVIPVFLFSLPAGHVADNYNRQHIVIFSQALLLVASLALAALSWREGALPLVYATLFLIGVGSAFSSPAASTLIPQTVPPEMFENAATWSSSTWQLAAVIGPALGGVVIALTGGATLVYLLDACASVVYIALMLLIRSRPTAPPAKRETTLRSLADGLRFLGSSQVLLAAITLDMFAVLLGGATTLLPIFAKDILHVGPVGLGWLRAAPSVGAVLMALIIAHTPPFKRAGRVLLWAVVVFGVATIVFGLSRNFYLSLAALLILGAADNISVVIRHSLVLLRTPDALRGRIAAVNGIFISASNELGGFESGLVAYLLTPVIAVVAGGIGTIVVVLAVALLAPEMRNLGALAPSPEAEESLVREAEFEATAQEPLVD
jgi:MFS family permease